MTDNQARLRQLPSVDRLLNAPQTTELIREFGRDAVRDALRVALDTGRQYIRHGGNSPSLKELLGAAQELLYRQRAPSLRPVINATGIILHTNLGRAPLSESAQQAVLAIASGYSTLEYDLEEGGRGKRDAHAEAVITAVTGAEAAIVVNNNAAAINMILTVFAKGHEVLISRGQLVEIGGGFRVPDVMKESGARLVEVGTTNRTHIEDFTEAITPSSALILRAHSSNFKQIGFVEQPDLHEIAEAAHAHQILAIDDLGSGALLDTAEYGMDHEPTVQESLQAGFDLVAFSGDKLLGGPQAGIIAGRAQWIAKLKKHPLARALRVDKLCIAALVATLEHYRRDEATKCIPVWRMIAATPESLRDRAEAWQAQVGGEVLPEKSAVGGGSLPGETLPTFVLALNAENLEAAAVQLRHMPTPVIARITHDRLLFDPRTVLPNQDDVIVTVLKNLRNTL
jgi:L-seryl-tRNA(Ser) seleniumtransferase